MARAYTTSRVTSTSRFVMCLAVSARIIAIHAGEPGPGAEASGAVEPSLWRRADVDYGGVRQQVSLACLPEARVGDHVLVHVGLALSVVLP